MSYNKLLKRQIKRALGIDDATQLDTLTRELESSRELLSTDAVTALQGLKSFIELVDTNYHQFERDLTLSHHMMEISSQELLQANENLRRDVEQREKALQSLHNTANQILAPLGRNIKIDGNNLEELADVLSGLVNDLNDSGEQLRMTLQNAPDAVFITEQNGRIVYVNDNTVEQLGYIREELYQMSVFDLVPEKFRDSYQLGAQKMISTQMSPVIEIRLVTKSGEIIPMEMNASFLPNGRIYGSCRDIRERKIAQKELKDSQDNLQRMMGAISEGMYGIDTKGICTFTNASFLRILGYENESEVIGQHMHKLIHHSHVDGSHYPANECLIYKSFQINQPETSDAEVFWRKDGTSVPVQYWSQPVLKDGEVIGSVITFLDITQHKLREQEIHQLAFYDPLTKLPNRRLFLDRLQRAIATGERNNSHGALIFLDLDNFKSINDTQGHEIGDQLLIEASRRLMLCVREGDTVARLGGDEFVIALQEMSSEADEAAAQAKLVAEKIQSELVRTYELNHFECTNTASIGIVIFRGHQEKFDTLLKNADTAMYQAKAAGRNTIRFYDPAMQAALELRIKMESELHQALKNNQFDLYYQIQVDYLNRPLGAEVLLRWDHPEQGIVSPAQFIGLAEETGLISPIGLWVLKTACEQLCVWQDDELTRNLTLSVNVSAKQFYQADFVSQIQHVLQETGAKPSLLKLELTESTTLENIEDTIEKMNHLKSLDISFSMDDFGTGYSSLQYLKRLPLDQIKIDQSFVRDLSSDPNDAAIVKTIIAMTSMLGLNVIAEGVETDAQLDFLNQNGCHAFQGFLFSQPIPIDKFEKYLHDKQ
ncbi:MAG: EAL domain-containing protein [Gallionella sp.]